MNSRKPQVVLLSLLTGSIGFAEVPKPRNLHDEIKSPEISSDLAVTFRLKAPLATHVNVWGDWDYKDHDLVKDDAGIWSVKVGPLSPNIYAYSFHVDEMTISDPQNPSLKPSRSSTTSVLYLPGNVSVPFDRRPGVKSGILHLHDYDSKALGIHRKLRVYTPPGYDPTSNLAYPVLYLLHGAGDNEAVWSEFGKANIILDNLIAEERVRPMIVVMTDGHPETSNEGPPHWKETSPFERDLLSDVIPLVESQYHVVRDRDHRAIAGLSMGGYQSLVIGLNHRDLFSWVGGMSSAMPDPEKRLANFWLEPISARYPLHLLWLRIGASDFLLEDNRSLIALLAKKGVPFDYREGVGAHTWPVWRENLTELLPRLFAGVR